MELEDTVEALRTMTDDDMLPPMVDLGAAMAEGRRRRRNRRIRAAVGTVVAVAAIAAGIPLAIQEARATAAPPSPATNTCTVARLPVPTAIANPYVPPSDYKMTMDPTGRYVTANASGASQSDGWVLWDGSKIAATDRDDMHEAVGVSSAGVMALGPLQEESQAPQPQPQVYRDGKAEPLPLPSVGPDEYADAPWLTAVSGDGRIGGWVSLYRKEDNQDAGTEVLVWTSSSAQPAVLSVPTGWSSVDVDGFASGGTVVGRGGPQPTQDVQNPVNFVVIWPAGGQASVLPRPDIPNMTDLFVDSVSGNYILVTALIGTAPHSTSPSTSQEAVYDLASGEWTVLPDATSSTNFGDASISATGVSALTERTGRSTGTRPDTFKPYLMTLSGIRRALPLEPGAVSAHTQAISADGHHVVGYETYANPQYPTYPLVYPVRWACG